MKFFLKTFAIVTLGSAVASIAHADGCISGTPCQTPGPGSITGHTITTISASVQNSNTAIPNGHNSVYYFVASQGAFSTTPDNANGTVVILGSNELLFDPNIFPNSTITATLVVVGGKTYNMFVEVCPPGTTQTDPGCTAPISLGSVLTNPYPPNPGFQNVAPVDTTPSQFIDRTLNVQDESNVTAWIMTVNNLDPDLGGSSNPQVQQPYVTTGPNAHSFTVTSGMYPNLLPNRKYTASQNLVYTYNQNGPTSTTAAFFTQPADPKTPASVMSNTRFTVTVQFTSNVANHNPTTYRVLIHNGVGLGGTVAVQKDVVVTTPGQLVTNFVLNGLTPDPVNPKQFTAGVLAINEGGAPWRNSNELQIGSFTVQPFQVTITFSGITTNFANANLTVNSGAGLQHFRIINNGTDLGGTAWTGGNGSPATQPPFALNGLNPNTVYTIQAVLCESPLGDESECSGNLPVPAATFTTTPTDPSGFALVVNPPVAKTLHASWTVGLGNPIGTHNEVQYFAGTSCSGLSQTVNVPNNGSATDISSLLEETSYSARVRALSVGGGANSNYSNCFTTTTINEAPVITSLNCPDTTGTSTTCTAQASDNDLPGTPLKCTWAVSGSASISPASGVTDASGNCPAATVNNFPTTGSYTVTLTVADHGGTGGKSTTQTTVFNVGQTGGVVTIHPSSVSMGQGGFAVFTASVTDQLGNQISNPQVNWSVGACATLSGPNPASSITVNGLNVGSCQLTGSYLTATPGQATINVSGTAPNITGITLSPNPVTGTTGVFTVTATGFNGDPLKFHWAVLSSPGGVAVDFNPVDSAPGANTSTATFHAAGNYTITCTAIDTINTQTTTQSFSFTVQQSLGAISVCPVGMSGCPKTITVKTLQSQQFTASGLDQFGAAMTLSSVVWSSNVSASGAQASFNSPSLGQNIRVTATSGGKSDSAIVNVVSFDVSNAYAFPVPFKSTQGSIIHFTGLGSDAHIRIYTATGRKVFEVEVPANTYDWNVKNTSGENLASGVYLYVIESPDNKKNGKLIIIQ